MAFCFAILPNELPFLVELVCEFRPPMKIDYSVNAFDYHLPEEQIAQEPSSQREGARLLQVNCCTGAMEDGYIESVEQLFHPEDILVVNDTRVFPARLHGCKESGGKVELMLLHYPQQIQSFSKGRFRSRVSGLVKASRRPKVGGRLFFGPDLEAVIVAIEQDATVLVDLEWSGCLDDVLNACGSVPLPPYIRRQHGEKENDKIRYQTVYARENGAIAAPTAGLHFSEQILAKLKAKGCRVAYVTLHVGYGTFAPVRVEDIRQHQIHTEYVAVPPETVRDIQRAKASGGRVWAVGTTTARALEFATDDNGKITAVSGQCSLYIYPGYTFKTVDNLVTNFHLPKSSLLFMVSAFAGYELAMDAYKKAVQSGYRFYSYGDAMALMAK